MGLWSEIQVGLLLSFGLNTAINEILEWTGI